jgi:hypothetical protein
MRILTTLAIMTVAAGSLHAQSPRLAPMMWVGEAQSYEVGHYFGANCTNICGPPTPYKAVSGRWVHARAIGVDVTLRTMPYSRVVSGVSVARRGTDSANARSSQTYVTVPILFVAEPFATAAPLGVTLGAGVTGDWNFNRVSRSKIGVVGDAGAFVRVPPFGRITAGTRFGRALTTHGHRATLRSETYYVGVSLR